MKGFESKLEEAGFSGFLTKPIDVELLLSTLAGRLGARRIEGTASTAPATAQVLSIALTETEAQATRPFISRLHDHPRLRNVVCRFAKEFPGRLQSMDEPACQPAASADQQAAARVMQQLRLLTRRIQLAENDGVQKQSVEPTPAEE